MRRFLPILGYALSVLTIAGIAGCSRARAERMVVERVVPSGATLTYSEGGVPVRTVNVPEGRVKVIIEYGGAITPRHGRRK